MIAFLIIMYIFVLLIVIVFVFRTNIWILFPSSLTCKFSYEMFKFAKDSILTHCYNKLSGITIVYYDIYHVPIKVEILLHLATQEVLVQFVS